MTKNGLGQQQKYSCFLSIHAEMNVVQLMCQIVVFVAFVAAILILLVADATSLKRQHLLRSWPRMVMISSKQAKQPWGRYKGDKGRQSCADGAYCCFRRVCCCVFLVLPQCLHYVFNSFGQQEGDVLAPMTYDSLNIIGMLYGFYDALIGLNWYGLTAIHPSVDVAGDLPP
jgi:hypothetical protein